MTWFRVDDGFHRHRKVIQIPRARRFEMIGVWTTAGDYAADKLTSGRLEAWDLDELGITAKHVDELARVALWHTAGQTCDHDTCPAHAAPLAFGGVVFHDWYVYNPDAATVEAAQEAKRVGGLRGNHVKWHERRGLVVADCDYCSQNRSAGDSLSDRFGIASASHERSDTSRQSDRILIASDSPVPVPDPEPLDDDLATSQKNPRDPAARELESNPNIEALCAEYGITKLGVLRRVLEPAFGHLPDPAHAIALCAMVIEGREVLHPEHYVAIAIRDSLDELRGYAALVTEQLSVASAATAHLEAVPQ